MANCSEACSQQLTEVNALNSKLALDEQYDDRRETRARVRAWENLSLMMAQNSALISHALNAGIVLYGGAGTAAAQQTVSPVRTGTGDNLVAGAAPSNRVVDETGAVAAGAENSATAQATLNNVSAQLGELTTMVTGLSEAVSQIVNGLKTSNLASLFGALAPVLASMSRPATDAGDAGKAV